MKPAFLLAAIISANTVSGQTLVPQLNWFRSSGQQKQVAEKTIDRGIKVLYADTTEKDPGKAAWFVDGHFQGNSLQTLIFSPQMIESMEVMKEAIEIDGIQYSGQIQIRTKDSTGLKFVSLADIKDRYAKSGPKPVLFMVDGKLVNSDYDKYKIDESYISEIFIDQVKNPGENIALCVIKVFTKSKLGNYFKSPKSILIRGSEIAKNP